MMTLTTRVLQSLLKVRPFILTSNPSANKLKPTPSVHVEKRADYEIWNTNCEAELHCDAKFALKYLCAQDYSPHAV